ncbi:hypothetical protein JOD43_003996 [Pullulanibacillus pueri]|uniref:Uncharacterized protein n=1 Tax=Pullulanibacillus pueri TaxID=1437324 RepID=A0A8J3EP06_9BACL|nr:hypothetical protein [Pullulanibacillus pueri]MBM7683815.1 hypothetical protein [Pullulanibacillus pueri]GGH87679.1 hypothetical protein GCM10007096_38250 [Pullulanibacillus pueri]
MKITKRADLIIDQYGNYYYAIDQKEETLRIVNAFMDLSYRRILDETYMEMHAGERIGQHPYNLLKDHIHMVANKRSRFKLYTLEEIEQHYDVILEPLYIPNT